MGESKAVSGKNNPKQEFVTSKPGSRSSKSKGATVKDGDTVTTSLSAISSQIDMTDSLLPLLTVYSNIDDCKTGIDTVLDIESQNSFISSELVEQLKLEVVSSPLPLLIKGMNATRKLTTRSIKLPVKIEEKLH